MSRFVGLGGVKVRLVHSVCVQLRDEEEARQRFKKKKKSRYTDLCDVHTASPQKVN